MSLSVSYWWLSLLIAYCVGAFANHANEFSVISVAPYARAALSDKFGHRDCH
jgi:hypothetical protein